jgi:hypothetical protein
MNAISTVRQPVLQPATFGELVQFAKMAAASSLVPKDYINRPENVMLAVQMGSELGLSPMQAIQNIAVISGRPAVWGDAMLGLVRSSPLCEDVIETMEGEGDTRAAVCTVKRRGSSQVTSRFSAADAKKAGLLGKPGPWQQYPDRMMQMRARGFALRDAFPDVLRGLVSAEEARDMATIEHRPEPRPAPDPTLPTALTTGDAIGDAIPDEPPPKPDPIVTLRQRLAACVTPEDVGRVQSSWARTVEKASGAGQPFPETLLGVVDDMMTARLREVLPQADVSGAYDDGMGL